MSRKRVGLSAHFSYKNQHNVRQFVVLRLCVLRRWKVHLNLHVLNFYRCLLLQPVSSSKDKPSKIHRRKHQIGTLLHDMKSKEMELLERRAKGNLTKAETHAKYGW